MLKEGSSKVGREVERVVQEIEKKFDEGRSEEYEGGSGRR